MDHLLTFANLRQLGLLVEQQPGETLTVMESKVGKLVNDKTAGERGVVVLPFVAGTQSVLIFTSFPRPGKLSDAFSSLAKKSHFRALSRKLNLVGAIQDVFRHTKICCVTLILRPDF